MKVNKRIYNKRGFRESQCLDDNGEQPFRIVEDSCIAGGVWLFGDIDIRNKRSLRHLVREIKKVLTGKGWQQSK